MQQYIKFIKNNYQQHFSDMCFGFYKQNLLNLSNLSISEQLFNLLSFYNFTNFFRDR